jgi:hypothetical protein
MRKAESTRAATTQELVNRARRAVESLDAGVDAIDNDCARGYDDVTRALRLLLAPGDGNRLLLRLIGDQGLPMPRVTATPPVTPLPRATQPLIFGMGAIPATGVPASAQTTRRAEISIDKLMSKKALFVDGSIANTATSVSGSYSWAQLIGLVANKLGAVHADDQVPVAFDEVYRFGLVEGVHPIEFAIRAIAVATCQAGVESLTAMGEDLAIPSRSLLVGPSEIWIGELHWYGRLGGMVEVFLNAVSRAGSPLSVRWTREPNASRWP